MKLLLDSHALYWWTSAQSELNSPAHDAIGAAENDIYVSAASAWEFAIKLKKGLWPEVGPLVASFHKTVSADGFALLDVTAAHALAAGALERHHDDPFDRMLIAQALAEGMTLVSNEELFDAYGVSRLW